MRAVRWVAVVTCVVLVVGGPGVARSADAPAAVGLPPLARIPGLTVPRVFPNLHAVSNVTVTSGATDQLSTYGRPIRVGHSTYWLDLDVLDQGAGSFPQLFVDLLRIAAPGHFQLHEYSWLSTRPPTFAVNARTMTAHLSTGRTAAPSVISLSFSPEHVYSHSCTLMGGGTGVYRKAIGTISVSAFKVVTNTSPVFGTITVRPRKAVVTVDPGCASSIGHVNANPCPPPEVMDAPGLAQSEWAAAPNAAGTRVLMDALSPSTTLTREQHAHLLLESLPISDLPTPTATATGATAVMLTRGSVFASGEGVFTSTHAPRIFAGSCTRDGVVHTYTASEYRGVFSPGVPRLIALWDTGHIPLAPNTPAFLLVSRLTS